MNTLDQLRIKMGITRPKMIELIGAKPGRISLLTSPDSRIDPVFIERAQELFERYSRWKQDMSEGLDIFEDKGATALDVMEVQELFKLTDPYIRQMRTTGVLKTERRGAEYFFLIASIREALEMNNLKGTLRGHFAFSFLNWLKDKYVEATPVLV